MTGGPSARRSTGADVLAVLAHVSDLHLDGSPEALGRVEGVVSHLRDAAPALDAVLVTGDVSDRGAPEDYRVARRLLDTLSVPVLAVPGNHDRRAPFAADLSGDAAAAARGRLDQRWELDGGVVVWGLDSLVEGRDDGELDVATLEELDRSLAAAPDAPTVVALHHHPVPVGVASVDALMLRRPEELGAVLVRHPHVVGVLCGHAHTAASGIFAGRPLAVAPGVRSQLRLPWEPPGGAVTMMDATALPAVSYHAVRVGGLLTHTRLVLVPR